MADFVFADFFEIPISGLVYNAKYHCDFSIQGESMVNGLISLAPVFSSVLERIIPLKLQLKTWKDNNVFSKKKHWKIKFSETVRDL